MHHGKGGKFITKRPFFRISGSKVYFTLRDVPQKVKLLWKNGFQIWKVEKIIYLEAVIGF